MFAAISPPVDHTVLARILAEVDASCEAPLPDFSPYPLDIGAIMKKLHLHTGDKSFCARREIEALCDNIRNSVDAAAAFSAGAVPILVEALRISSRYGGTFGDAVEAIRKITVLQEPELPALVLPTLIAILDDNASCYDGHKMCCSASAAIANMAKNSAGQEAALALHALPLLVTTLLNQKRKKEACEEASRAVYQLTIRRADVDEVVSSAALSALANVLEFHIFSPTLCQQVCAAISTVSVSPASKDAVLRVLPVLTAALLEHTNNMAICEFASTAISNFAVETFAVKELVVPALVCALDHHGAEHLSSVCRTLKLLGFSDRGAPLK